MPSFYKTNLIDKYDSSLISPQKDPKKVEDVEKNEAHPETNKTHPGTSSKNVQYPYKSRVHWSHNLMIIACFVFLYYWAFTMPPRDGRLDSKGHIIPQKFLDPCNATNAIPLDEVEMIKEKIASINDQKHFINNVIEYSMFASTNEYFKQKLANLTEASTTFTKQLEQQKEIRFICYKQNLEELCENRSLLKEYKRVTKSFHAYAIAAIILYLNSLFHISKARKCGLSPEQEEAISIDYWFSHFIIILHLLFVLFMLGLWYLIPCPFPWDLKKFSI